MMKFGAIAGLLFAAAFAAMPPSSADARACIAPTALQQPTSMARALCIQGAFVHAIGAGSPRIGDKLR